MIKQAASGFKPCIQRILTFSLDVDVTSGRLVDACTGIRTDWASHSVQECDPVTSGLIAIYLDVYVKLKLSILRNYCRQALLSVGFVAEASTDPQRVVGAKACPTLLTSQTTVLALVKPWTQCHSSRTPAFR